MSEAAGHAAAVAVVLLALCASATPEVEPDGEPLFAAVPDQEWILRGSATLVPEVSAATLSSTGCPPGEPCRGVVAREVELPVAGRWIVRASVERVVAGQGSRVFLSTTEPRWFAGRGPAELGRTSTVEATTSVLPAGPAELGVVVRGDEVIRVGELTLLPARPSVAHVVPWWGAVLAAAAGGVLVVARARREVGTGPILALGAAFLAGVMAPRDWLDRALLLLPGTTRADLEGSLFDDPTPLVLLQKLGGHGVGFALLGALGRASGVPWATLLARLLSFAAATEAIQLLLPDRSGRFTDVAIDLGGGLVGAAAIDLTRRVAALRAPRGSAASRP